MSTSYDLVRRRNKAFLKRYDFFFMFAIAYGLFIVANLLYYWRFSLPYSRGEWEPIFGYALSTLDHGVYQNSVLAFVSHKPFTWIAETNNAVAMGFIYYVLEMVFHTTNIVLLAFFVNNAAILVSYLLFYRIARYFEIRRISTLFFFLNPLLVFYSQLITKESFSLLIIMALTYSMIKDKKFLAILLIPLSMLVRIQYGPMIVFSLLINGSKGFRKGILLTYIATSFMAIFFFYTAFPEAIETGVLGISNFIYQLNKHYYIGSLVFNPVRIVLYIYDFVRPLYFVTDGQINLHSVAYIPIILVLIAYSGKIFSAFAGRYFSRTECRPLLSVIASFVLVLLMNPITHARYLFPITYLLVLVGIFVKQNSKSHWESRTT